MNPSELSAEYILSISEHHPERLFSKLNLSVEHMRLRKFWHPDFNSHPDASRVFIHINALKAVAENRIADNLWDGNDTLEFTTSDGGIEKKFRMSYRRVRMFELGKMYIGKNKVMYVLDEQHSNLYHNGIKAIKGIKYPKSKYETEFKRFLPEIVMTGLTSIGYVVVVNKPSNAILLQDVIEWFDDDLDPKHVAWITSSLYNLTVFFDRIRICHNAILPSTVFIDPEDHTCLILGGWWYSTPVESKLLAMPLTLLTGLPKQVLVDNIAKGSYDRIAVKRLAIKSLGDKSGNGSKLLMNNNIPKPLVNWLRMPSTQSALEEYTVWFKKVLPNSFGKRRFIKLNLKSTEVYGENS